jgi:tetrahydrodipicolinate N-succinyltransferase
MSAAETSSDQQLQAEVERLRARVSSLESELVEVQDRANTAVAEWQERAYWLDRWHLDLNALMRKPGAAQLRGAVRSIRAVTRAFRLAKRRLRP